MGWQFPVLALREFGGKLLMWLGIVEAKMAVPGVKTKNSRFNGNLAQ
jgi:hypothetical protein